MVRSNLPAFPSAQPLMLSPAAIPLSYVNPGISLSQLLSILLAHRKQSLVIALTIIALTCVIVKVVPRRYVATATLMLNYQVNDPLGGDEFPIGLMGSYIATQTELMQSSEVLLPVIERLHLMEKRSYAAGFTGDGSSLNDWVERKVAKNLTVEQGRYGSQLIYVGYAADNREEAAAVANAVADVYSEQQFQRQTGPASERAQRYTSQLEDLKAKVGRAQDQVTDFRQRTGLIASDVHVDVDMEMLSSLEQRLLEAQNLARQAEAGAAADQSVAGQVLSSSLIQTLKSQLASQQARLAELTTTMGRRHPQVLELQSEIAATRGSLATELRSYSSSASSQLVSNRQIVEKLQQAVEDQKKKVLGLRQLQDEAAKFTLELDSAQTVYKRALDSYDQIMVATSGHYTNVRFISRAAPPLRAAKPNLIKLFALGCMLALIAAIIVPVARELFNRRIRCRDDLERDHGIPVLAELSPGMPKRAIA
jgi:succinoglycan biosynthesis transport protein ExoP